MSESPLRRMGQSGVTLVEVLVMIVVVVPVVIGATAGMFTAVHTSDQAETQTRLEALLSATTEDIKAGDYITCGTASDYNETFKSTDISGSVEVLDVRYWSQNDLRFIARDDCQAGNNDSDPGTDGGAQQIKVKVSTSEASVIGVVVSRNEKSLPAHNQDPSQ